jgi:hypothetical protein
MLPVKHAGVYINSSASTVEFYLSLKQSRQYCYR